MKKYFLLVAAFGFILFSSCSNDDDAAESYSIEGRWALTAMMPPLINLDCPNKPTLVFDSDGTLNSTVYDKDCKPESGKGSWQKNSGNNYTISIPGSGDYEGTANFDGPNKFTLLTTIQGISGTLTFEKAIFYE